MKGVSAAVCGSPIYDGATKRVFETLGAWQPQPEPGPVRRIRLEFLTPLRLRTEGRYNASPDFGEIARALLVALPRLSLIEKRVKARGSTKAKPTSKIHLAS